MRLQTQTVSRTLPSPDRCCSRRSPPPGSDDISCDKHLLLAPQSGAQSRGVFRGPSIQPNSTLRGAFKPVYTEAFLKGDNRYG